MIGKNLSHYKILKELGRGGILNQTHLSFAFCTEAKLELGERPLFVCN